MIQPIPSKKRIAGKFGFEELEELNAKTLHAVLATSNKDKPYTSLIAYAYDAKEKVFLFLTPKKTTKYSNMTTNPNVSLLIDTRENTQKDYLSGEAYTILGEARSLRASNRRDALLKTFLKKHPKLKAFSKENDIALIQVSIGYCFKVGRFQEVHELSAESA